MLALDEDARAASDAGTQTGHGHRPAGGPGWCRGPGGRRGWGEDDGGTVDEEPGTEREGPGATVPVLEDDDVDPAALLRAGHGTAPAGLDLLDDIADGDGMGCRRGTASTTPVPAQDVGAISIHPVRLALGEGECQDATPGPDMRRHNTHGHDPLAPTDSPEQMPNTTAHRQVRA